MSLSITSQSGVLTTCRCRQQRARAQFNAHASPASQEQQGQAHSRSSLLRGSVAGVATLLGASLIPSQPALAEEGPSTSSLPTIGEAVTKVTLRTLRDSELSVSVYPTFSYDALGGGGEGTATRTSDGRLHVVFDPATVTIPDVKYGTAKFLGLPLVPPLKITVQPSKLEGFVDPKTGQAELEFVAEFFFTAGPVYSAPPLLVTTLLTTETCKGAQRGGTGRRIDAQGRGKLVGVAEVPRTNDAFMDNFLMLPSDTFAGMSAQFTFS